MIDKFRNGKTYRWVGGQTAPAFSRVPWTDAMMPILDGGPLYCADTHREIQHDLGNNYTYQLVIFKGIRGTFSICTDVYDFFDEVGTNKETDYVPGKTAVFVKELCCNHLHTQKKEEVIITYVNSKTKIILVEDKNGVVTKHTYSCLALLK